MPRGAFLTDHSPAPSSSYSLLPREKEFFPTCSYHDRYGFCHVFPTEMGCNPQNSEPKQVSFPSIRCLYQTFCHSDNNQCSCVCVAPQRLSASELRIDVNYHEHSYLTGISEGIYESRVCCLSFRSGALVSMVKLLEGVTIECGTSVAVHCPSSGF